MQQRGSVTVHLSYFICWRISKKGVFLRNYFESIFQTKPQYNLDKKVTIMLCLKNISDRLYTILSRDTPLDQFGPGILNIMLNGEKLNYDKILVKHSSPIVVEYLKIDPNEIVTAQADITSAFEIDKPIFVLLVLSSTWLILKKLRNNQSALT